ncbi:SDR family oxidoreductase [Devosia sp. WQ 349]|uniref:UDP-glucuronic acid decarboxylase family protein n=1 Tax=Devosia sp. WQ 349K1 TaxID=2800329 RepID=UPI0019083C05|nr:UDP-glucuronic acid decarboxylase family protein [Devosia sp. WQ 349K1]MBK1794642.1 SDR family oxidoreductase [Devosia sp. WQ 349K1]
MSGLDRTEPKTILVAGGAGFLGSHLCETLLGMGAKVLCLDSFQTGRRQNIAALENHPRFKLIEGDVRSLPMINDRLDEIYNLACPASPPHYQADPIGTMMTCVLGTKNLLDLAEANGARLVQASTSEVYGDPDVHPQREDYVGHVNCTGPRACYDEGKRAAEALCFDYLRLGKANVRVARIFNTYGPRMRADDGRIVSNLIVQALAGQALTIYGDGTQTRSFCFVSDLVAGLCGLMALQLNPEAPVNLGNPGEFTISELAEKVSQLIPGQSRLVYSPLPADDPKRRRPDISRAEELMGWRPRIALDEGLMRTVAWFAQTEKGPALDVA